MLYVRNYSINPSYRSFLKEKRVIIESDICDTDYVEEQYFQGCLEMLKDRFPGYVQGVRRNLSTHTPRDWEIYDTPSFRISESIIPTMDDIKGKIHHTLIPHDPYDNVLIYGRPILTEDFDISLLDSYQEFGFSTPVDFVMTLSAIKSSEILTHNKNEATWIHDGRKTVITSDMHGDMQVQQVDGGESINLSHIRTIVPFKPIEKKLLRSYFHSEYILLAIAFAYIEQMGATKDLFGEYYIKIKEDLEQGELRYGPYGNAGDYDKQRTFLGLEIFKQKIANFSDTCRHIIPPNPVTDRDGKGYYFYIGFDNKLYVYEGKRGNQDSLMKFDLIDAENIIRGIISNTKNGIGRTGIGEVTELINAINRGFILDK